MYYVYVYLDPRKPGKYKFSNYIFDFEPIYIGKGKNRRLYVHLTEAILHPNKNIFYRKLNNILIKNEPIYFILEDNLSNIEACNKEIELISLIGRLDENKGTLCNLTNGGEGTDGYHLSDKTKQKISIKNRGENNGMYGKKHTMKDKSFDEFFGIEKSNKLKNKIYSNSNPPWKDKNLPEDMKNKISETLKKRFKDKNKHPMFGKKHKEKSKALMSKKLKNYYKNNPISDEYKKHMSNKNKGENNPCFTSYVILNQNTGVESNINGRENFINFIMKYKKDNNILPKRSPSHVKLLSGQDSYPFKFIRKIKKNKGKGKYCRKNI